MTCEGLIGSFAGSGASAPLGEGKEGLDPPPPTPAGAAADTPPAPPGLIAAIAFTCAIPNAIAAAAAAAPSAGPTMGMLASALYAPTAAEYVFMSVSPIRIAFIRAKASLLLPPDAA